MLGICINFPEGYSNTYPNTSYLSFKLFLNETAIERGYEGGLSEESYTWIWSAILNVWHLGFLFGNLLIPVITEKFGRKNALLYACSTSLCSSILSCISIIFEIPELYFVARGAISVAGGITFGTLILFLQETTPTHLRGVSSFLAEVTFLLCTVVGMGAGMDRFFGKNLVVLTAIAILPGFICLFAILPLHETPKYLLLVKNNLEAAKASIGFYYGLNTDKAEVLNEIAKEALDQDEKFSFFGGVKFVLSEAYLRTPYLIGVASLQLVMGLFPMIYLSTEFLEEMFDSETAQLASFGFILCQFLSGIPGTYVVSRFGRRPLLLLLGVLNMFSFVLYVFFDKMSFHYGHIWGNGCIVALCIFGISYGLGLGPISCFITSELVVQKYRSLVQSMMFVSNTFVSLIVSYLTLPAYNHFGCFSFVFLFIIPSIFSLFYLYRNLPETKDREIHEIVRELKERVGCCEIRAHSHSTSSAYILSDDPLTSQDEKSKFII
ncbi:unnamed protein product, partial [Mesorhabditis belari]|uniref:Major facilitator superfamily (MFS) profile domain-containing protein n=1 Tax=Mesorhabditis belari TaxID=2138241 RepID=A0AAF3J6E6_9BILA